MRFLKFFSFDDFNNFGDYFIKILEKLSIDLVIIINLYEHKTMAEDRPIDKISEENYHQFYEKWFHGLTLFTFIKIIRKLFRYHIFFISNNFICIIIIPFSSFPFLLLI